MPEGACLTSIHVALLVVFCLGLTTACTSQSQPASGPPQAQSQGAPAKRYDLKGKVVSVDKAAKKLVVDNEEIPGFMSAMTMPYPVKDEHLLDKLAPGYQITAKVVSSGGEFWLEDIAIVKAGAQ